MNWQLDVRHTRRLDILSAAFCLKTEHDEVELKLRLTDTKRFLLVLRERSDELLKGPRCLLNKITDLRCTDVKSTAGAEFHHRGQTDG